MRRRAALLGGALLTLAVGAAAGTEAAAPRPLLRIAAQGSTAAFDAELLGIFAKLLDRTVVAVSASPGEAGPDVVAGVLAGDARIGALSASSEVLPTRLVAVTRRPAPRAVAIEALRWTRVGVTPGSRAATAVREAKISGAELVEADGLAAALAALRAGGVKALLLELPEALVALRRDPALELGVFVGARQSYVFAMRREDPQLAGALDRYLRGLRSTPSWAALVARHFGPQSLEALARAHLTD